MASYRIQHICCGLCKKFEVNINEAYQHVLLNPLYLINFRQKNDFPKIYLKQIVLSSMTVIKHLHKFKLVDYLEVLVKLGGEAIWTMALFLSISKITFRTSSSVKAIVRKTFSSLET
jgi:hypothetical protein